MEQQNDNTYPLEKGEGQSLHSNKTENSDIDYGRAVGKIAYRISESEGGFTTGELAQLRRVTPEEPFTPTLWKVLLDMNLSEPPAWISREQWERRWATLLMGMAFCAGLQDFKVPLGQALAEAGWTELRFVQLMRAKGEKLELQIRRIANYLAQKNQSANWKDVACLLFYQSGDTGEDIRLSISRSYYRTLYAQTQNEQ